MYSLNFIEDIMIFNACKVGNLAYVQDAVEVGYYVNTRDEYGNTLLHIALVNGNFIIADLLIKNGADLTIKNGLGYTSLDLINIIQSNFINKECKIYSAREHNALETPKFDDEIKINANMFKDMTTVSTSMNTEDKRDANILSAISESDKKLLSEEKKVIVDVPNIEVIPVEYDSLDEFSNEVKLVKKEKTDEYEDRGLKLILACYKKDRKVAIEILKDKEVPINIIDNRGNTPLLIACKNGLSTVIDMLLKLGANPNIADKDGNTPLMIICKKGKLKNSFFKLIESGAKIDARNNIGDTALIIACKNKKEYMVIQLINRGANIDIKNNDLKNALDIARINRLTATLECLSNIERVGFGMQKVDTSKIKQRDKSI